MSGKVYTNEFKQQAVELAEGLGNISLAAKQLGIRDTLIHAWRKDHRISCNNRNGKIKPILANLEQENKRLQKENAELKKVNHILKAAAAFFSQDHLK